MRCRIRQTVARHADWRMARRHRRREKAVPGLLPPFQGNDLGGVYRDEECQEECDRRRHVTQEQVQLGPRQVQRRVDAPVGHKHPYQKVEFRPSVARHA